MHYFSVVHDVLLLLKPNNDDLFVGIFKGTHRWEDLQNMAFDGNVECICVSFFVNGIILI